MEIIILPGADATDAAGAAGALAGRAVATLLERKPDAVLGLATGSSPLPVYDDLVARHDAGELSFARARAFTLDEYVGLAAGHPERYSTVIRREFTSRVDFADDAVQGPDGLAEDIPAACLAYDDAIRAAGGVDLQILGIGTDGHIGFNEPGSSFASRTRVKTLTEQTRKDNARFFDSIDEVPVHCITQGLGTILRARHLVLLAFGAGKARAVAEALEGPVSALLPASAIQLHEHVTVVVDEAAAARLKLADYYRYAFDNKPAWQGL